MKKFYVFAVIALVFAAGVSATAHACGGDKSHAEGGEGGESAGK